MALRRGGIGRRRRRTNISCRKIGRIKRIK
jgi:hypothetical protein